MSGPGQNYYLWYDLGSKKLTVVSWDLNLAMSMGDPEIGPHDPVEMKLPPGVPPPDMPPGGGPLPFEVGNPLKERFLASAAFTDIYENAYWDLYETMYADGRAIDLLDSVASTVPLNDGLSAETLRSEADSLRSWLQDRANSLERRKLADAGRR